MGSLQRPCLWCDSNPDELAHLPKVKIEALVQNFADGLAKKDGSRTHVNAVIRRLKTFFRVNGHTRSRSLRIATYYVPTRYRKRPEYIPSKNQIHKMTDAAGSLRNGALISSGDRYVATSSYYTFLLARREPQTWGGMRIGRLKV